jgi:hypothetical protein
VYIDTGGPNAGHLRRGDALRSPQPARPRKQRGARHASPLRNSQLWRGSYRRRAGDVAEWTGLRALTAPQAGCRDPRRLRILPATRYRTVSTIPAWARTSSDEPMVRRTAIVAMHDLLTGRSPSPYRPAPYFRGRCLTLPEPYWPEGCGKTGVPGCAKGAHPAPMSSHTALPTHGRCPFGRTTAHVSSPTWRSRLRPIYDADAAGSVSAISQSR